MRVRQITEYLRRCSVVLCSKYRAFDVRLTHQSLDNQPLTKVWQRDDKSDDWKANSEVFKGKVSEKLGRNASMDVPMAPFIKHNLMRQKPSIIFSSKLEGKWNQ